MPWSFYHTMNYRISVEIHVLIKCASTRKIRNSVEWLNGSPWWLPSRESNAGFTGESFAWKQLAIMLRFYFSGVPTKALHSEELRWTATVFYVHVDNYIPICCTLSYQRQSLRSQPLPHQFRTSLAQTHLKWPKRLPGCFSMCVMALSPYITQ